LELDQRFPRTHWWLGQAYLLEGELQKAVGHLSQAVEISGRNPQYVATLAYAYGIGGRLQEAERLLRELEQRAADEYVPSYDLSIGYVGLGETERAILLLEQALDTRDSWLRYIRADPRFDRLRDHPRFQALLQRYE
jgi:Flp pilus assembly protein TadD